MVSAREVYKELGYSRWDSFRTVVRRARGFINNGLEKGAIADATVTVSLGSGAKRVVEDYHLDEGAIRLVKMLSLNYKLGRHGLGRNETSLLNLMKEYCDYRGLASDFQYRLGKYIYDFRCGSMLIEFDEDHHTAARQTETDFLKEKYASARGFTVCRLYIDNNIIDAIKMLDNMS